MNTIGKNLSALIDSRDTTQSAIAAVSGASESAVSLWLSGRNRPRMKYLEALSEYYSVSMDELVSEQSGLYAKMHGLSKAPSGATAIAESKGVPVRVLGATYADNPTEPGEYEDEAMLYEHLAKAHPNCYALDVSGNCMDRVFTSHDRIFVDPDMGPEDGSIAVMSIDGESEVRRIKMGRDSMLLVSESHSDYPDIVVKGQDARCQGVVFWWQAKGELS